jgi:hypothetical protein
MTKPHLIFASVVATHRGLYDQLPLMKIMITFVLLFELMICYTTFDCDETSFLDHDEQC